LCVRFNRPTNLHQPVIPSTFTFNLFACRLNVFPPGHFFLSIHMSLTCNLLESPEPDVRPSYDLGRVFARPLGDRPSTFLGSSHSCMVFLRASAINRSTSILLISHSLGHFSANSCGPMSLIATQLVGFLFLFFLLRHRIRIPRGYSLSPTPNPAHLLS
jgi:hypothetical protein